MLEALRKKAYGQIHKFEPETTKPSGDAIEAPQNIDMHLALAESLDKVTHGKFDPPRQTMIQR